MPLSANLWGLHPLQVDMLELSKAVAHPAGVQGIRLLQERKGLLGSEGKLGVGGVEGKASRLPPPQPLLCLHRGSETML